MIDNLARLEVGVDVRTMMVVIFMLISQKFNLVLSVDDVMLLMQFSLEKGEEFRKIFSVIKTIVEVLVKISQGQI